MVNIAWKINRHKNQGPAISLIDREKMGQVFKFHKTLPNYFQTPLFSLKALANALDLAEILVKDESFRFNLNSFKALGSSYAIANYLNSDKDQELIFSDLKEKIRILPRQTFATATDGNHGLGVAWAAKLFDQHSAVFMPKGSSNLRLAKIQASDAPPKGLQKKQAGIFPP